MKIESPAFLNGQMIPAVYTCEGEGCNPPLLISGVPAESKSLALIVEDPDAPSGKYIHWTVWNLPPDTSEIEKNAQIPNGAQGVTSAGRPGYVPPCPPSGIHRYFFKLFALDSVLALKPPASAAELEANFEGHVLESAELIGLYGKNN